MYLHFLFKLFWRRVIMESRLARSCLKVTSSVDDTDIIVSASSLAILSTDILRYTLLGEVYSRLHARPRSWMLKFTSGWATFFDGRMNGYVDVLCGTLLYGKRTWKCILVTLSNVCSSTGNRWFWVEISTNQSSERVVRLQIHFVVFKQSYLSSFLVKLKENLQLGSVVCD